MPVIIKEIYSGHGKGAFSKRWLASAIGGPKKMSNNGGVILFPEIETPVDDLSIKAIIANIAEKYGFSDYSFGNYIQGSTGDYSKGEKYSNLSFCIEISGIDGTRLMAVAKELLSECSTAGLLVKEYATDKIFHLEKDS